MNWEMTFGVSTYISSAGRSQHASGEYLSPAGADVKGILGTNSGEPVGWRQKHEDGVPGVGFIRYNNDNWAIGNICAI